MPRGTRWWQIPLFPGITGGFIQERRNKMKKLFSLLTIFVLVFAACGGEIPTNEIPTDAGNNTTLEIKNRSSYELLQVNFGGVDFGTIGSGNGVSNHVAAGTKSIFFYLKSPVGNIYCRTDDVVTCKAEGKNEWVFINNTLIENIDDGKFGTLSAIYDEISITSSSLELSLNGNTFSQSEVYDFGFLIIGKTSEITFTIKSTGQENLIIGYGGGELVYLENNPQGIFSVTQPSLSTIIPGSSTSFKVIFSPTAVGTNLNAVVHIENNSWNNGDFFFTVKGSGRNYLVGDIGPAGGYIFYDKGTVTEGWRYMEAAPAATEFTAQWGASDIDVTIFALDEFNLELSWMTLGTVGSGKDNTNLIVALLNQRGETNRAAQRCKNLVIGGYNDWFLPSIDDFIWIDNSLYRKGLGGFGAGDYWSSSQANSSNAKSFNFSTYSENSRSKTGTLTVRAVRSF
jgi:hypothetical protein